MKFKDLSTELQEQVVREYLQDPENWDFTFMDAYDILMQSPYFFDEEGCVIGTDN